MNSIQIERYKFDLVCQIIPLRNSNGTIQESMPQDRYQNVNNYSIHKYGQGPYCTFRIPNNWSYCGVYTLTVNNTVAYIGECLNLTQRFNMGYGQISPRNPYEGGQPTNCRINSAVLTKIKHGNQISLWFYTTNNYKAVEYELRSKINPPWNRI